LPDSPRGLSRPLRFRITLRRKNRWHRWRGRWRRGSAFVCFPGLLGKFGLPSHRYVFVSIGDLGHHRAGDAGFGLRHKPLQFRAPIGEIFALGLELLAIVQLILRGIGERRAHAVAHVGTAVKRNANRDQRRRIGRASQRMEEGNASAHAILGKPTMLRLRKAGVDVRIEALPKWAGSPKKMVALSLSFANSIA